jgi:hypothetical protein
MEPKIKDIARDEFGKKIGNYKECVCCKKIFIAKQGGNKTCSESCATKNRATKMSENRKGKPSWNSGKTGVYSSETREAMGIKNKGKVLTDLHREKISQKLKSNS